MSYSITPIILPYKGKDGLSKISLQVIYRRMKLYVPTPIKVSPDQFAEGFVIKHKNKVPFNDSITTKKHEIEKRLLEAIRKDHIHTKRDLERVVKTETTTNNHKIFDFVIELTNKLKGKLSEGRLKHYKSIANKIEDYSPDATFGHVSVQWLNNFEAWLRKTNIDGNTVLSNMNLLLAIFNKANAENLLEAKQYKGYKRPKYNQKLVEYLTEDELLKIKAAVDITDKPGYKRAGYYFLLSSFTGFRFSDSSRFNYEEMVKGDAVVLQATKNSKIISIPLYPQLTEVLNFVKEHPLNLSNDKTRKYVQEICKFVGIRKEINYHSSRHSFGMMLISKGFSIDEVAELLGDTKIVTRVYAKISNEQLKNKFRERLG